MVHFTPETNQVRFPTIPPRSIFCTIVLFTLTVDGHWTKWIKSECGGTCPKLVYNFSRTCTNPKPRFGGKHCEGEGFRTEPCSVGVENPIKALGIKTNAHFFINISAHIFSLRTGTKGWMVCQFLWLHQQHCQMAPQYFN